MKDDTKPMHQSLLPPADNKFHVGNGDDGKHYWLTPPELLDQLAAEHGRSILTRARSRNRNPSMG